MGGQTVAKSVESLGIKASDKKQEEQRKKTATPTKGPTKSKEKAKAKVKRGETAKANGEKFVGEGVGQYGRYRLDL